MYRQSIRSHNPPFERRRRSACVPAPWAVAGRGVARLAPGLLEAVHGHDPLGHLELLAAPGALVGALTADLHGRVTRGALSDLARRQRRRIGRQAPVSVISPSVSPVLDIAPEPRDRLIALGQLHQLRAALSSPSRPARSAALSRTGRACPHAPPSRRPERARRAATTSCEVIPAGLSISRMPSIGCTRQRRSAATPASGVACSCAASAPRRNSISWLELQRRGEARRAPVSAAALLARDHRHVHFVVGRAQRHFALALALPAGQLAHSAATFVPCTARRWSMMPSE